MSNSLAQIILDAAKASGTVEADKLEEAAVAVAGATVKN